MEQPLISSAELAAAVRCDALVLAPRLAPEGSPDLRAVAHVVSDVAEFGRLLRATRPAVVVVFVPPATPNEIEFVARVRRRRRDLRAVLIDHPRDSAERLAALRAGFDDALGYAVAAPELSGRLRLLAERARGDHTGPRITLGGGTMLDLDARELRIHGRPVHLRPREAALLEVLARNPGRTFTREKLLASVGAGPPLNDTRTIDVHVRWLREKLEAESMTTIQIVTVRGVGYRLERRRRPIDRVSVNGTLTERERDVDRPTQDWDGQTQKEEIQKA